MHYVTGTGDVVTRPQAGQLPARADQRPPGAGDHVPMMAGWCGPARAAGQALPAAGRCHGGRRREKASSAATWWVGPDVTVVPLWRSTITPGRVAGRPAAPSTASGGPNAAGTPQRHPVRGRENAHGAAVLLGCEGFEVCHWGAQKGPIWIRRLAVVNGDHEARLPDEQVSH